MYFSRLILALSAFSFALCSHASLVDYKQKEDIVYFLHSSPNKLVRYDLTSSSYLNEISLDKEPTAFEVIGGDVFVGFHRELRKLALDGSENTFVRNTSSDIKELMKIEYNLIVTKQDSSAFSIDLIDFDKSASYVSNYIGSSFISSDYQQAYYYYRALNSYQSQIYKVSLGIDDTNTTLSDTANSYNSNRDYPNSTRLYLNGSENKIYDDAGTVYFSADLTYAGSLSGAVDAIAFLGDNAIAARNNVLHIFNSSQTAQGTVELTHSPFLLASYSNIVFSFAYVEEELEILTTDISSFNLPRMGAALDAKKVIFKPDISLADGNDILYMLDRETLSVFRWSASENDYLASWPVINPPALMAFSANHERLYLAYPTGKISYFDTSEEGMGIETDFITLPSRVSALLPAGNFLYAVSSNTHYSFSSNAELVDFKENRSAGSGYVFNDITSRIHLFSNYSSLYTDIDKDTGLLGEETYTQSNSEIILSKAVGINEREGIWLNGAGQLISIQNSTVQDTLSGNVNDAIWVDGKIVSITFGEPQIQFWGDDFELLSQLPLANSESARLFNLNGSFLLSRITAIRPDISVYSSISIIDTDEDGVHDLEDNCFLVANTNQQNYDNDALGDACDADDDNDGLPDSVEIEFGLDSTDETDAGGDADGDGFSNRVEFLVTSDFTNANSKPAPISEYIESFESGWPLGFYTPSNALSWAISATSHSGSSSLKSALIPNIDSSSDVKFDAYFANGILSFNYFSGSDGYKYYNYQLELYVDGTRKLYKRASNSNSWSHISVALTEGVHSIHFKVTADRIYDEINTAYFYIDDMNFTPDSDGDGVSDLIDNCPNAVNPYQDDYDQDGIGDNCDNAPFGQDADNDGWGDTSDNCPTAANSNQEDLDIDGIGNVCDDDIDGDGISNDVEAKYTFLDPENKDDALLDHDGDGASNLLELQNNVSPESFNQYYDINLLDYFPLGSGELIYSGNNNYTKVFISEKAVQGQFQLEFSSGPSWSVEYGDDGIYLNKVEFPDGAFVLLEGYLIMPNIISIGDVIDNYYNEKWYFSDGSLEYEGENVQSIFLKSIGNQELDGVSYPTVTLADQWGTVGIFLKGIGQYTVDGMNLDSSTLVATEVPDLSSIEDDDGSDSFLEGLGSTSGYYLFLLSILLFRRLPCSKR